jgi:penicillin-binding protein 1A
MLLILAAVGLLGGGVAAWGLYQSVAGDLPDYRWLADYQPPQMSRIYAADSKLMAELANERRVFVPLEAIPRRVQQAFVSSEDQRFWEHHGVDPIGILRAVVTNVESYGSGRRMAGASTITQQVAKNMLVGNDRTMTRKLREAILATRLEQALSKERILELYLNEIFLGAQAYGVAAAAQAYFNKSLDELSIAEAAFLGGLPKAPNNYNPLRYPEAAKSRRDSVVDRMAEDGIITAVVAASGASVALFFRDDGRRWQVDAAGGVETFFPCALGAEPALSPGYSLSREPPQAPPSAVQAPLVPLSAVIDQFSDTEIAAALSRPVTALAGIGR